MVTVDQESNTGNDPHSETFIPEGQGRTGSFIALGWLMAARAVPDVPVGITAVRDQGTKAVIEFGAASP